ncbi:hypothetical protein D3C80_1625330 [compost metagenome]
MVKLVEIRKDGREQAAIIFTIGNRNRLTIQQDLPTNGHIQPSEQHGQRRFTAAVAANQEYQFAPP